VTRKNLNEVSEECLNELLIVKRFIDKRRDDAAGRET
jgi:hypothetical protein